MVTRRRPPGRLGPPVPNKLPRRFHKDRRLGGRTGAEFETLKIASQRSTGDGEVTAAITASLVKQLREMTGAGMMDCKKALIEAAGDIEKAVDELRKRGQALAAKRSGRTTGEGLIFARVDGAVGALVELNCETDFVARNEEFRQFADNLAMHIAASAPIAVSPEDIDPAVLETEKDIYRNQALNEGKKPEFVDKIIEGRVKKFCAENCLLSQVYIRDESRKTTIEELLKELIGKIGENINVKRFARFSVGS